MNGLIDPSASDCKKVTRYVNTASDIKPQSDKLPANNPPGTNTKNETSK